MRKSILMYSLFALVYFAFSTFPLTEVSAQGTRQRTIAITSGNNQETTRGKNFPNPVVFEIKNENGNPINDKTIEVNSVQSVEISLTATGAFSTYVYGKTNSNGEFTVYARAKADSFYHICEFRGRSLFGSFTLEASFTGTITDVLYFSDDATTRSVVEGATAGTDIGAPVFATHWANADTDNTNDVTLTYSLEGTDAGSFSINPSTGQLTVKNTLGPAGSTYSVTVKVEEYNPSDSSEVRSSDTIDVTITVDPTPPPPPPPPPVDTTPVAEINAGTSERLTVRRINSRTVMLAWDVPTTLNAQTIMYEYSINGGNTWTSTGNTNTSITITQDGVGDLSADQFKIRAMNQNADGSTSFVIISAPTIQQQQRILIQDCPVGWVRSDGFAGRNRRVLLYEVNLEMDIHNLISIYKPIWVAIYVHPDEGLENLQGWKLQVALPYNHHSEYLLTAENSVVVDAGFVEGGFAFIENPAENPFPMVGIGFTGSPAPGFDYRLYDETGKRVDFGISCYKRGDIFSVLQEMEDPRVLRQVLLESFDWDTHYLRSEWTVPVPVNAPGAPSLQGVNLVGTWADLKKQ